MCLEVAFKTGKRLRRSDALRLLLWVHLSSF